MTNWIRNIVDTFTEIREIREAMQMAVVTLARAEAERDKARSVIESFADTNVRLARKLERAERLNLEASRLVLLLCMSRQVPEAEQWLDHYDKVRP